MKKKFSLWLFAGVSSLMLCSCGPAKTEMGALNVIPMPREVVAHATESPFVISGSTRVVCPAGNEKMQQNAAFLSAYVKEMTGVVLQVTNDAVARDAIVLKVDDSIAEKEGYTMTVNDKQIVIAGGSEAGVFYGIQTLHKAMPVIETAGVAAAIPAGVIKDAPRFAYRGFMLDVCRHFFPVSYIKQVIDMCALHNINYFHWHLTEDQGWRLEIKKYPKLTEIGSKRPRSLIKWEPRTYDNQPVSGFYTQEEAKEIVKYAADRYITVVPEVDMPGHMMAALASYPELGCTGGPYEIPCGWGVFEDVLCGGSPKALQFAKDVMNEILDIFPSPYIHIGGDECPKSRWEKCKTCQAKIKELGLKSTKEHSKENQLQTYFMGEIGKLIQERGRKMLGWDEMLHGGLAPGATVMSWTSIRGGIKAAQLGHDAIITPIQYLYFSNPHYNKIWGTKSVERVYNFEPMPKELTPEQQKHIIGVQACLWTEWTADSSKVEWQIFPRLSAAAELQWSAPEKKNFDGFLKRLVPMMKIYEQKGYEYRKDIYEAAIEVKIDKEAKKGEVSMHTLDGAEVRYTLDGTEPSAESAVYEKPFSVDKELTIKAMVVRSTGNSKVAVKEVKF